MNNKFFLYARKSTDVEDKQVLSIEAQLTELRSFAKQEGLHIVDELIEKKSAKVPGRSIFNDMLERIEQGEANGIIGWHPDRLARNSVDGGRVIYLLDCGHLAMLKFPTFWFENTSQGKFMLNIAFGQSKYYVDSLSENTKRGLRQKVRRGEYPSLAPVGYINDPRTKTVVIDQKTAPIIREAFERYAKGDTTLQQIGEYFERNHLVAKNGKRIHISRAVCILKNPFYYGHFRYVGELHEGKHEPIVSKKLFDQVQSVMADRSRPRKKDKPEPQAYCGLITCATCSMMVTGEYRTKTQLNGTKHYYTYYHCTKKRRNFKCPEPYVRQEALNAQVSEKIKAISLPPDWAEYLRGRLKTDRTSSTQSVSAFVTDAKQQLQTIDSKLQRLLDGYLEQDIEREVYRAEKAKLLSKKKSLTEEIETIERTQKHWLEPLENWIQTAENLDQIASDHDLFRKKVIAKEIFGSNLRLHDKILSCAAGAPAENRAVASPTAWAALRAAHVSVGQKPKRLIMEPMSGIEPETSSLPWTRSTY